MGRLYYHTKLASDYHNNTHICLTMVSLVTRVLVLIQLLVSVDSFTIRRSSVKCISSTQLHMGLFDGVKEAFSAPARTTIIDAERETPIDRWMGWSVSKDKDADGTAIMTPQASKCFKHRPRILFMTVQ